MEMRNLSHKIKPIRMKLQNRIILLQELKKYLLENGAEWQEIKEKASRANGWFTPEFIDLSIKNITEQVLDESKLAAWAGHYHIDDTITQKNKGKEMTGTIKQGVCQEL